MAQKEAYWVCDIGGEKYQTRNDVRNDIVIVNGEHSRIYGDVCDRHAAEVAKAIDRDFPKNKNVVEES